jgi:hypothetical protein
MTEQIAPPVRAIADAEFKTDRAAENVERERRRIKAEAALEDIRLRDAREAALDAVVRIANGPGNWDATDYHFGMANGLLLAQSIIKGTNPEYREPTAIPAEKPITIARDVRGFTRWLCKECGAHGGATSKDEAERQAAIHHAAEHLS